MSDIVTRLWGNTGKYPGFENLNTEAAAEIERLRARVAELEADKAERDRWKAEAMAWREVNDTAQVVRKLLRIHTHGALVEEAMKTSEAALVVAIAARAANGGEA